ncbi:MAG: hypothetical protein IPJ21_20120 [Sterolibacteriaceae bacterium]|nr:hypothetical protein [Sterolibacteriaceae bacterium]
MTCLLRISGDSLDIDALLSNHPLLVDRVWRKGAPKAVRGTPFTTSGVQLLVSDTNLENLQCQTDDAIAFLTAHLTNIKQMVATPGVQDAALDFGIGLPYGYVAQFSYLPVRLVRLAAEAGLGIYVSQYVCGGRR